MSTIFDLTKDVAEKLEPILEDFINDPSVSGDFSECKKLNFEDITTIDYSNLVVQKLYYLKYYYAYLAEYWSIYDSIFQKIDEKEDCIILSMGCGGGVDYMGARYAAGFHKVHGKYYGYDSQIWLYKDASVNLIDVGLLTIRPELNILCFPKSLGDLTPAIGKLKQRISQTSFENDLIYLAGSFRKSAKHQEVDRANFEEIISGFVGFGQIDTWEYSGEEEAKKQREAHPEGKGGSIYSFAFGNGYPDDIKDFMMNLPDNCPKFSKEKEHCDKANCADALDRFSPVLTVDRIIYKVVVLGRKSAQ